jgi:uncharacterized protein (UPF0147 family)
MPAKHGDWREAAEDVLDEWAERDYYEDELRAVMRETCMGHYIPKSRYPQVLQYIKDKIYENCLIMYTKRLEQQNTTFGSTPFNSIRNELEVDGVFEDVKERLRQTVDLWEVEAAKNPVPPPSDLALLATDRQSVHTVAVNKQTNENASYLKAIRVPAKQQTMNEILNAWIYILGIPFNTIQPVLKDMTAWGKKSMVIVDGDFEYRKVLRGLWAKIKEFGGELQKELIQRLWEECSEAVELCAQGHISRLCNVLAGFVDDYKVEVNVAEVFQEKMADLGRSRLSVKEKIAAATRLMDDIEMPAADREAWLEALGD